MPLKLPFYKRTRKSKHDTLRYILKKGILDPNDMFAEFGVYKGTTIRMIAKQYPDTKIYGFDHGHLALFDQFKT